MKKKNFDLSHIANELKEGSVFFKDAGRRKKEIMSERADEPKHLRSNEPTLIGSKAGMSERVDEPRLKDSKTHGYRIIHRLNADLFLDQLEFIEDQTKSRRRVTGKNVTKGEILREMVDFYISNKK